jgi:hypothetical protein
MPRPIHTIGAGPCCPGHNANVNIPSDSTEERPLPTTEALEALKQFVTLHDLPQTDMSLYGVRCPYCGKSDRIQPLEPPDEAPGHLTHEDRVRYARLWRQVASPDLRLGLCKFCLIPLQLTDTGGASALVDE